MIGVILISHGELCKGMYESLKLFFGTDLSQTIYLPLRTDDDTQKYSLMIERRIRELDDGSGVLILVDVSGGTPANSILHLLSDRTKAITGMNLPMLLEIFSVRQQVKQIGELDLNEIISRTRESIVNLNELVKQMAVD